MSARTGRNGRAVVLLHSLGTSSAMWEPQVEPLARRFDLVTHDLPGHGGRPSPPGPYSVEGLADGLDRWLTARGLAEVDLVGSSIGGMVAMAQAAARPQRVGRMVLIGTSARLGPPEAWAQRAALVESQGMAAVSAAVAARWLTPAHAVAHPADLARLRGMLEATDPSGYAACCRAIERMDLTDRLAAIVAPTLVIVGEADPATPAEHARLIAQRVADGRLAVVPGSHLPSIEQPDVVTELIIDHLDTAVEARTA